MKKFFLFCMMFAVTSAFAQTEQKPASASEPSAEISAWQLATSLIQYGYAQEDAYPLIQALRIMNETPSQEMKAKSEAGAENANAGEKQSKVSLDFATILADAKAFAGSDALATKLIAEVEKQHAATASHRGAVNGPQIDRRSVSAHSYVQYCLPFRAGTLCEVLLSGDGDTDLDLYVYDSNGNLIVSETSYSDQAYVSFIPYYTTNFYIKVVNRGNVYNVYTIMTN